MSSKNDSSSTYKSTADESSNWRRKRVDPLAESQDTERKPNYESRSRHNDHSNNSSSRLPPRQRDQDYRPRRQHGGGNITARHSRHNRQASNDGSNRNDHVQSICENSLENNISNNVGTVQIQAENENALSNEHRQNNILLDRGQNNASFNYGHTDTLPSYRQNDVSPNQGETDFSSSQRQSHTASSHRNKDASSSHRHTDISSSHRQAGVSLSHRHTDASLNYGQVDATSDHKQNDDSLNNIQTDASSNHRHSDTSSNHRHNTTSSNRRHNDTSSNHRHNTTSTNRRRNERRVDNDNVDTNNRQAAKENNWRSTAGPLSPKQPRAYRHVDDYNNSSRKNVFQPYISPEAAQQGIREGSLYQGIIRLTKNRNDAYVIPDDLDADVYISGLTGRNRSLHGDNVVVRLLDVETVWNERQEREAQRRKERAQKKHNEKVEAAAELDDNIDSTIESLVEEEVDVEQLEEGHKPTYCGEVVSILERSPNFTFAGTITATRFANTALLDNNRPLRVAWFKPNDLRVPFLVLRNKDIPDDLLQNPDIYRNTLFSATISHWPINDPFPTGTIIREIGPLGDLLTEKEAILADNSIIRTEFSSVALRGLPDLPWCIPESEVEKRRDLRNERIFSIDPSTAKDLDDALHIKELADGFYEVGVHIADVGYFLKRGSPLDTEAYERGTSTYLVDSVIPMLPSILCEELCSLNPGVDRLAFSVIWKMDFEGKIVDTWFGKTVIRSCAKLAYEDAQCVIDGQEMSGDIVMHDSHLLRLVSGDIFMLNSLATGMRRRRFQSGSLTLNSVKLMFELDLQGRPTSVKKFESKDANHLVEEFMLCANISVAKKIASVYPQASLLRKHEPPLERRLNKFLDLTEELGLDFAGNTAGELQRSFDKIKNKDVKDVLLVLAIRCMQRAKYFSSGSADSSKYLHYALNEKMYTHFTSPIRRYADVIVHRILEAALENNSSGVYEGRIVQKMTFKCNSKKDAAKNAQDTNIGLYLAKYLSNYQETKGPVYTKADVIYVGKETYEVYVPLYGLEKKFHVEDLPTEQHYYDKETHKLDIFWKAGVPVTMHNEEKMYAQRRILKDDYSDDDLDVDIPIESLTLKDVDDMVENDDLLVPPVVLEENTCLQRLSMFSRITVRIQVNDERSPPIINVYPVNPFSGESVVEIN